VRGFFRVVRRGTAGERTAEKLCFSAVRGAAQGSAAILQIRCVLKNEAKQKSHFLLCVVEKVLDGLFQHY
jgi:hypothetical protein